MKFVSAVQNQDVGWPTQLKFNRQEWLETANTLCQSDADNRLAQAGIWIADTLEPIRKVVNESEAWNIPFEHFVRYSTAICNRDFAIASEKLIEVADNLPIVAPQFIDEMASDLFEQEFYGAQTLSGRLESGVDATELCLLFHKNKIGKKEYVVAGRHLKHMAYVLNFGVFYQAASDFFYQAVYNNWYIRKENGVSFVVPKDIESEKKWAASFRRFNSHIGEFSMNVQGLWSDGSGLKSSWFNTTGGIPVFKIRKSSNYIHIKFEGRDPTPPASPPKSFINELIAREFYYEPLLQEPLPKLNNHTVLDLLKLQFLLMSVAEQVMLQFPSHYKRTKPNDLRKFSPTIDYSSLVSSFAEAMNFDPEDISILIDTLTRNRKPPNSIWHHPLIPIETNKGRGLLFVLLPILEANIYRNVDYWLSKLGLPLEKRGNLFEEEVLGRLERSIQNSSMNRHISICKATQFLSEDQTSGEEIDILIRLGSLIILGEVKCQKFPVSPLERHNYINTLKGAATQAKRKATWVELNLEVVAKKFSVDNVRLSGKIIPIIISNHALGVGMEFEGVPVLDLLTITNYISNLHNLTGTLTEQGWQKYNGKPFYSNLKEMVNNFEDYAFHPAALNFYYNVLKPQFINFPLRRQEEVYMLDFVMDYTLIPGLKEKLQQSKDMQVG